MTVRDVYAKTKQILQAGGIEDHAEEARLLLCHFLRIKPSGIYLCADQDAGDAERKVLLAAEKRRTRYPLQYILGEWPFMGLMLSVGEGVLIPRDDTEVLVRTVSEGLSEQDMPKGLDLCAGTGAVSLGICSMHPGAVIEAVELYPGAFFHLEHNCDVHPEYAVTPVQGDITDPFFCGRFRDTHYSFIASNPPYVTDEELRTLQPEIGHEPATALLAKENGLFFYRAIMELWTAKLIPGGRLAVEIGETQAKAVRTLFRDAGFTDITVHRDLSGLDRCVCGIAP